MAAGERYEPCVLCGSRAVALDCSISLRGKLEVDVTECRACGLLFANPVPSAERIASLYDSGYWDPEGRGAREASRRYRRQYRFGAAYGERLGRAARTGRMLEVGCGLGFFLKGVADHCGWEVEGIDAAEGVGRFAREKLGLRVTEMPFEQNGFPDDSFDLVRAKDVLEHVPRPMEFLGEARRILRPGGELELWLPNGPLDLAEARRAFRRGARAEMGAGHLLFIRPRTLRAALEAAGFGVARMEVSGFRYALKALGLWPVRPAPKPAGAQSQSETGPGLEQWERPPAERGLKGGAWYARLREWRSRHPALPAWLPLGFRQRVVARKR